MIHARTILPFQKQVPDKTSQELIAHKKLQAQYTRSCTWRSLFAFLSIDSVGNSVQKISKYLRISTEDTLDALDGLQKLGLIKKTVEGYEKILKYVYFSDRQLDKQSVLTDHVMISSQVLSRLSLDENKFSFYRTGFVATNEALAKEFCQDLEALMKSFIEKSSSQQADCVMAMSFSQTQVSEPIEVSNEN